MFKEYPEFTAAKRAESLHLLSFPHRMRSNAPAVVPVAFYFPRLIPPSDSGSSHLQPAGAERNHGELQSSARKGRVIARTTNGTIKISRGGSDWVILVNLLRNQKSELWNLLPVVSQLIKPIVPLGEWDRFHFWFQPCSERYLSFLILQQTKVKRRSSAAVKTYLFHLAHFTATLLSTHADVHWWFSGCDDPLSFRDVLQEDRIFQTWGAWKMWPVWLVPMCFLVFAWITSTTMVAKIN